MLAQGDATGDASILEWGKAYIKEQYQKPGNVFLGLVHRLDRPVSGVMVFARTSKAAARLSEQFRKRTPQKIYHAIVEGSPPEAAGTLVHYLSGGANRTRIAVHETERPNTKRAELQYRLLESKDGRSRVEVKLITGAKHQIRAQLARVRCPIVGDFKYDNRQTPARPEQLADGRAIALHARSLTVEHPTRLERLAWEAPFPPYWPWD